MEINYLIYKNLDFPVLEDRVFVFINMVTTIDGKIVSGSRNEPVSDLGSDVDYQTMRYLETQADAVMVGAGNVRATEKMWYPKGLFRLVVTESGNLPTNSRVFTDEPEKSFVVCPEKSLAHIPSDLNTIPCGKNSLDFHLLFKKLKTEFKIDHLLVEGGAELNASLLKQELVDELFLTISPKIKLGKGSPTYADGEALPREKIQDYKLISCIQHEDEVFLRYRKAEFVR